MSTIQGLLRMFVSLALVLSSVPISRLHAGEVIIPIMPRPGAMVNLSPVYTPALLNGLIIHHEDALKFDFLIRKGDGNLDQTQKSEEYTKLIKYFLASLTLPDEDQWVNLSPYENDRIIQDDFGKTEMGRDLLAQDYLLKQITSSLMYPESGLGREFWDRVFTRSHEVLGNMNVPVNTFNKVWIVPDELLIYESGNTAYVAKSHLKVMMEEDYLSLQKHSAISDEPNRTHTVTSRVVKEVILPQLEREVNEGKNFAQLRQIFSGMALAAWYKKALRESLLGKIYADKAKVKGVDLKSSPNASFGDPEKIYKQYLVAFKKGVFNYIKEDVDKYTNQIIPRKYFSGGFVDAAQTVMHRQQANPATIALQIGDSGSMDLATAAVQARGESDVDSFREPREVAPNRAPPKLVVGRNRRGLTDETFFYSNIETDSYRVFARTNSILNASSVPDSILPINRLMPKRMVTLNTIEVGGTKTLDLSDAVLVRGSNGETRILVMAIEDLNYENRRGVRFFIRGKEDATWRNFNYRGDQGFEREEAASVGHELGYYLDGVLKDSLTQKGGIQVLSEDEVATMRSKMPVISSQDRAPRFVAFMSALKAFGVNQSHGPYFGPKPVRAVDIPAIGETLPRTIRYFFSKDKMFVYVIQTLVSGESNVVAIIDRSGNGVLGTEGISVDPAVWKDSERQIINEFTKVYAAGIDSERKTAGYSQETIGKNASMELPAGFQGEVYLYHPGGGGGKSVTLSVNLKHGVFIQERGKDRIEIKEGEIERLPLPGENYVSVGVYKGRVYIYNQYIKENQQHLSSAGTLEIVTNGDLGYGPKLGGGSSVDINPAMLGPTKHALDQAMGNAVPRAVSGVAILNRNEWNTTKPGSLSLGDAILASVSGGASVASGGRKVLPGGNDWRSYELVPEETRAQRMAREAAARAEQLRWSKVKGGDNIKVIGPANEFVSGVYVVGTGGVHYIKPESMDDRLIREKIKEFLLKPRTDEKGQPIQNVELITDSRAENLMQIVVNSLKKNQILTPNADNTGTSNIQRDLLGLYIHQQLTNETPSLPADTMRELMRALMFSLQLLKIDQGYRLDRAMSKKGGIDLNASNLNVQIKRDGRGVPLPLPQQDMAMLSRIEGFVPTILEIKPFTGLPVSGN